MGNSRGIFVAVTLASATALADPNDFQVYKLGCPTPGTCASATTATAQTANDLYRVFVRELGAALTSTNLMPPSSLGHDGFAFDAELSVVDLKPGGNFVMPTTGTFSGPLLLPSVHVRKGLPFSFEIGSRVTWIDKSRMGAGELELKWSVNEGFAYLPDIGIRGAVTRLFNNRDFDLTAAGLDIGVGKRFAIGGMLTLTPYVGWNLVWIASSSNTIDFQPGRSYQDSISSSTAQLDNTGVYDQVTLGANEHNRFYAGLRFIIGVLQLGAEVSWSNLGSFQDAAGATVAMPAVWSYNSTIGLDF